MNVNKININQSEPTYNIASNAYNVTYENSNVGDKLNELNEKVDALALGTFYGFFSNSTTLPIDVTTLGYAYVGTDNPYEIWNFNGESWSDSGTSIDMNVDADEEDITRNRDGKLQFKDRAYGDGMGYVILRKDKSFAEQMTKENTIYVIRYDFTLTDNVTIPANCILQFEGGSISNKNENTYSITGNKTNIQANVVKIFNTNITLAGTWCVSESYPEWFGAKTDLSFDSGDAIQACINSFLVVLLTGRYYSTKTINIRFGTYLFGKGIYNSGIHFDDTVSVGIISSSHLQGATLRDFNIDKDTKTDGSSGILLNSATNITIEHLSVVRFDYGFDLNSYYVCTIRKCDATSCTYGFYFGRNNGNSTSVTIDSCYALWCDVGYELKKIVYSTLNSCACDQCRIAYDFWHAIVNLNGCGCELIEERALCLESHIDEDKYGNFNINYVIVNNFIVISSKSTVPLIKIACYTRGHSDRNVVKINQFNYGFLTDIKPSQYLVEYGGGDTQLYLNNIQVYQGIEYFDTNYSDSKAQNIYIDGLRVL